MKRVCVYCGSKKGYGDEYVEAANALGMALVDRGLTLVYGGGNIGLMGTIASTVLARGGDVIGVIPEGLIDKEIEFLQARGGFIVTSNLSNLHIVRTMHERKALMAELSDIFVALPGGFGTLEEMFEVVTWTQLGLHHKPCGLINVNGFYDPLVMFFDRAVTEGFIRLEHRNLVLTDTEPHRLLNRLLDSSIPSLHKWLEYDRV